MTSPAPDELFERALRFLKSDGVNRAPARVSKDHYLDARIGPYQIIHYFVPGGPYDDISAFVLTNRSGRKYVKIGSVNNVSSDLPVFKGVFSEDHCYKSHISLRKELLDLLRRAQLLEDLADV